MTTSSIRLKAGLAAVTAAALLIPGSRPARAAELRLTLTPSRGPIGTLVHIRGTVAREDIARWAEQWDKPGYFTLIRDLAPTPGFNNGSECELLGGVRNGLIHIDKNTGQVTGSFRVPSTGTCFQTEDGRFHAITPGTYGLSIGCHACDVGATFTVTGVLARTGHLAAPAWILGLTLLALGMGLRAAGRWSRAA